MNLKKLTVSFIKYSLLPFLVRFFIQKNKVTIIYYHNLTPNVLDAHLTFLKKYYNIISLQSYLFDTNENKQKYRLIVTFDDGHVDNYKLLPILLKHKIIVTIFLTTKLINTKRNYWFLLEELSKEEKEFLKNISDEQRIEILKQSYGFYDDKNFDVIQALTIDQIQDMLQYVDFQSHSQTHPCLPKCTYDKAKNEIFGSLVQLKSLNIDSNSFAFPNGDYTEREVNLCKEAGYICALSADHGFNAKKRKEFVLKRIKTGDTEDVNELFIRVTGVWGFLKQVF